MAQTVIAGGFIDADLVSAQTALTSGLVSTDELIISDAGVLKRMDISVLEDYIVTNLGDNNIDVTQSSHGFAVGDVIRMTTTNNTYAKALADTATNAEVIGIVIDVTDTNNFTYATSGEITVAAAVPNSTTAGDIVYLSTSSAGGTQTTEPSTTNQISKPIAVITEANNKMVLLPYRGEIISSGATSFAPVDATYLALSANGTLTGERVLTAGTGLTLADAGAGGAATLTIDNDSITFAKMQNVAANSVLVRNANSSGDLAELALATTQILIGNGTGFTAAALSGDVTMSNAGVVTIAANAVDSTEITSGAIDLAHMSSQSVDEDNLYISNAGTNGQFLSKQSGNNGGLTWADAGGNWNDLLSDGLHNGTFANIFFLGPHQYDAISTSNNNDQFGLGNAFKAEIYGGGSSSTLSQHADFRGLGWAITSGNADQRRYVLYAGGQCVAVNDDWTIQCTINSASGNMFEFGLITNPANYKPHSNASYRSICFFQDSGTDIGLCTSDGTTRSLRLVSGWNYSNTHKIKLMIREAGTKVSLVVDGTTVVDETTNNLPTGWTGMFLYLNASSWSANSRTTHLRDFIAFSEG